MWLKNYWLSHTWWLYQVWIQCDRRFCLKNSMWKRLTWVWCRKLHIMVVLFSKTVRQFPGHGILHRRWVRLNSNTHRRRSSRTCRSSRTAKPLYRITYCSQHFCSERGEFCVLLLVCFWYFLCFRDRKCVEFLLSNKTRSYHELWYECWVWIRFDLRVDAALPSNLRLWLL